MPLVNGVGVATPAIVDPELGEGDRHVDVRLDASEAIGIGRQGERLADLCVRLFLMIDWRMALIVDRIVLRHTGRVESRLHTMADVRAGLTDARLVGLRQQLTLALAASQPFRLTTSTTVPTTPGEEATLLRWHGPRPTAAATSGWRRSWSRIR